MSRFDLTGKKGLIVGIANQQSIAYGCAKALNEQGANLAITYLNDKAKPHVEPLADEVNADLFMPCDVTVQDQVDILFDEIENQWGELDFLVHSIAYAPLDDLHGRLIDSSRDGFLMAMDLSCHSLMRLVKKSEGLMKNGGSIFAMTYLGSEKVINNYNLMGPVKAALESSVRYLAYELGPKNIRVHAISPGPIATRAASGLAGFDNFLEMANNRSPLKNDLIVDDVGSLVCYLASDAASSMTGDVIHVDRGYHIMG
ncbi:MAG: enoyl-ACP reductase FabI [Proteobacteria bacterium]|nr:enoyl-[acyl-carrier-protein] reductase FabI [Pseudomonadota bacterium]NOG61474.1 enoyl-ACP reductase FabI [Pseudomonadota bacterium]